MRDLVRVLWLVWNQTIGQFYTNVKKSFWILSIEINPLFKRRSRPEISRYTQYTRDILKRENFEIGEYTYGLPRVETYASGEKLKIGKFCSIAGGVTIQLVGFIELTW